MKRIKAASMGKIQNRRADTEIDNYDAWEQIARGMEKVMNEDPRFWDLHVREFRPWNGGMMFEFQYGWKNRWERSRFVYYGPIDLNNIKGMIEIISDDAMDDIEALYDAME